jgi:glycosyltransferase involved in cell wall biosynthesis
MLYELAQGLADRGHAITMYAAQGSCLPGLNLEMITLDTKNAKLNLADFNAKASSEKDYDPAKNSAFFEQGQLFLDIFLDIAKKRQRFDIVHAHAFDWPVYAFGPLAAVPTVHTMHLPAVDPHINSLIQTSFERTGTSNCVTVSKTCAATFASYFPFDRVIYNGIKVDNIPFSRVAEDFILFVGRMSPEKGVDLAIEIANRANKKLIIAGGIYDQVYFDIKVAPALAANPNIEYRGLLDRSDLFQLIGRAQAAIFPIRWEEPFGLSLAEVQAAGTPVVAFERGAAPEIVVAGETGFLIKPGSGEIEAAVQALGQVAKLDRYKCRERIAQHFSFEQMLDAYEDYYYSKILKEK